MQQNLTFGIRFTNSVSQLSPTSNRKTKIIRSSFLLLRSLAFIRLPRPLSLYLMFFIYSWSYIAPSLCLFLSVLLFCVIAAVNKQSLGRGHISQDRYTGRGGLAKRHFRAGCTKKHRIQLSVLGQLGVFLREKSYKKCLFFPLWPLMDN